MTVSNVRLIRLPLVERRWAFIAFMSVICALSPFAMSFPVPAFPAMGEDFSRGAAQLQWMISAFLIGLGVAQPIHGSLADRYGRRPVLLAGFTVFCLASLASIFTESWTALIICRFLQAVGVSAGTVTSRAIINDVQPREEAAISLSYVSIAMGVGPMIAPILGGAIESIWGWRSIFTGCLIAGMGVLFLAIWRLPETRPVTTKSRGVGDSLRAYYHCLKSPVFLGNTAMFGFGQGVFFAYLPVAPLYFESTLGASSFTFIVCWIALSLGFMIGSFIGTRLVRRFGMRKTITAGSLWIMAMISLWALIYLNFGDHIWVASVPLFLTMLGTGLLCPLSLAGSIAAFPDNAATAAGLSSALGLIIGGTFAVLSGLFYDGTLWPLIILTGITTILNFGGSRLSNMGSKA